MSDLLKDTVYQGQSQDGPGSQHRGSRHRLGKPRLPSARAKRPVDAQVRCVRACAVPWGAEPRSPGDRGGSAVCGWLIPGFRALPGKAQHGGLGPKSWLSTIQRGVSWTVRALSPMRPSSLADVKDDVAPGQVGRESHRNWLASSVVGRVELCGRVAWISS